MAFIAPLVLVLWIPLTAAYFVVLPPRRAVVAATVTGWLFLPALAIPLPGVPDITKSSAPVFGLVLSVLVFDLRRLAGLRLRWIDVPMIVWCIVPLASSLSNDLGLYDGLSAVLAQTVTWGLPYLFGRAYLADAEGLRELAVGIVVGGLAYVPLCLFEMRFSPILSSRIYGYMSFLGFLARYGGYRPVVFMATGLEVGMWMAAASLLGFHLWSSGVLKRLFWLPFGALLLPVLVGTTILCRSVGSLILLAVGLGVLWATRLTRSRLPVWAIVLLPVLYEGGRGSGIWDGRGAVGLAESWIDGERAASLDYRMCNEDLLVGKALQRPLVGWGGWSRSRVYDEKGNDISITDGLWIIALGNHGIIGLAALTASLLAPTAVLARRRACVWAAPEHAAASALAVLLALYMIDNLSNAMFNPIYVLAAGGLAGLASSRITSDVPSAAEDAGRSQCEALSEALALDAASTPHCRALGPEEAEATLADREEAWRQTVAALESERAARPPAYGDLERDLALAYERLARCVAASGRGTEALVCWESAVDLRSSYCSANPTDPAAPRLWADTLNDMAWFLVRSRDGSRDDALRAAQLADQATRVFPVDPIYWNTLGCACCRLQDWPGLTRALGRSAVLGGGSGFDFLLLAIALCQRGELMRAQRLYRDALARMTPDERAHPDVLILISEAQSLIDHSQPEVAG